MGSIPTLPEAAFFPPASRIPVFALASSICVADAIALMSVAGCDGLLPRSQRPLHLFIRLQCRHQAKRCTLKGTVRPQLNVGNLHGGLPARLVLHPQAIRRRFSLHERQRICDAIRPP